MFVNKMDLKKYVIKLKKKVSFKEHIYNQIKLKIIGDMDGIDCTKWSGYAEKHRRYSQACYIVYLKTGVKHYINPQKYIYNYLNYPDVSYGELIKMKNRVRNIDKCKNRGICCCVSHIEPY